MSKKTGFCQRCNWKGGFDQLLRALNASGFVNSVPSLNELKNALKGNDDGGTDSEMLRRGDEDERSSLLPKGIIPAWKHPVSRAYLKARKLGRPDVDEAGIYYCPIGYYAKRIIIPVFDQTGEYRTFVARDVTGKAERKYLYPKGCRVGRLLYRLDTVRRRKLRRVWMVEGAFDALHTRPYGVATFGKHLSRYQIAELKRARVKKVVLIWDWDASHDAQQLRRGPTATSRLGSERRLSSIDKAAQALRKEGFEVNIVRLPKKETDPTNYSFKTLKRWAEKNEG